MVQDAGACGWRTSIKSVIKGDEWHYGVAVSLSMFREIVYAAKKIEWDMIKLPESLQYLPLPKQEK